MNYEEFMRKQKELEDLEKAATTRYLTQKELHNEINQE